ncbi:DUF1648 domain-containing protein [Alkalicoccus urumqiensis]|uniref:DUF1648 domain-containing protein n=1 Tax=Alkalicoccus urumqiensis TaxID=1548213 RepID=A0A2P6MLV0_ALKUR|nr:DUF1648 domain-containing protein [Alkalicoccus urumqiensis]PRO67253.1 hypothetical protein C6I21_01440 [Alkalicoccus urumqiensis]
MKLDIAAWIIFLAAAVYTAFTYSSLPDTIPRHFNAAGEPTAFSGKEMLVSLVLLYAGTVLLLTLLNHFLIRRQKDPHQAVQFIQLPGLKRDSLSEEQAAHVQQQSTGLLSVLNLLLSLMFAYLLLMMIQTALGHQNGLSWDFWLLIALTAAAPVVMSWRIVRSVRRMDENE